MPRLLVGMIAALALVAAGCGGDDEGAPTVVKDGQEWQASVNELCTQTQQQVQQEAQQVAGSAGGDPAKAAAELLDRTKSVQDDLFGQLRDVDVPGDVRGDYDAFLDRLDDTLPLFEDLSRALRAGEEDPQLTKQLEAIAADTRPFAEDNGLNACLADGGTGGTTQP